MHKLEKQIEELILENRSLKEENRLLRQRQGITEFPAVRPVEPEIPETSVSMQSTNEEKVAIFRRLFKGREDLYPLMWENQKGKSGYSPACIHEWDRKYCKKPIIKCGVCENRNFTPLDDKVILNHLSGKATIGVYPMLPDESCYFLACDFDGDSWKEDSSAFLNICRKYEIPVALERSRSGNGGHIWIFFEKAVPSYLARKVGFILLTKTMDNRHQIKLTSYDRFFPNQDTMPKGGFGNLIALPLQFQPRSQGNSVFLNDFFEPYPDQWAFLSGIRKVSGKQLQDIVDQNNPDELFAFGRVDNAADEEEKPWQQKPLLSLKESLGLEGLPAEQTLVLSNLIYIGKDDLPSPFISRLKRMAAFQNPEFYRTQAMRMPTFNKPRIISCFEEFPRHIGLPRGCLNDILEFYRVNQVKVNLDDQRNLGIKIDVSFTGTLRPAQVEALEAIASSDIVILSAGTAFGKTVMAARLIAEKKVNTLVLVHRKQLMEQWKEKLSVFLGIPKKSIGHIGGPKDRSTGLIDVAMLQTLYRQGEVKGIVENYGMVIVDECHHISAFSFEQVMKKVKAKYILGLTATPVRKDGHHPIIRMQ